jgi:hypothetical protein
MIEKLKRGKMGGDSGERSFRPWKCVKVIQAIHPLRASECYVFLRKNIPKKGALVVSVEDHASAMPKYGIMVTLI